MIHFLDYGIVVTKSLSVYHNDFDWIVITLVDYPISFDYQNNEVKLSAYQKVVKVVVEMSGHYFHQLKQFPVHQTIVSSPVVQSCSIDKVFPPASNTLPAVLALLQ